MVTGHTITCSAPGKILITGGYLVLDPKYTGLVLSLSARIYTTISPRTDGGIAVYSPQFADGYWQYTYKNHELCEEQYRNSFLREALQTCLHYFNTSMTSFDICIFADNQYYSLPVTSSRFAFSPAAIAETPKTGLGSSAALVTSLCAALFLHFSGQNGSETLSKTSQRIIHNLAQIAHCRAQGKVGSGFDVASAVYGSCLYSRFPPNLVDDLTNHHAESQALRDVVDSEWPMTATKVKLRPGLRLLMGDVEQGSSTPGMVKKVKASVTAMDVWPRLGISNDLLAEYLTGNTSFNASEESKIRKATQSVRGLMKQMGTLADVEIEPDSQTQVLDKTLAIPGVIACGVPGAGGYDAIYAVASIQGNANTEVRDLWQESMIKTLAIQDDGKGILIEADFDVKKVLQDCQALPESREHDMRTYLEASRKARKMR